MGSLQEELDAQAFQLRAVQRNYDNVVVALGSVRSELDQALATIEIERKSANALGEKLTLALIRADAAEERNDTLAAQLEQAEDAASAAAQLRFEKQLLEEKAKAMSERLASADAQLREARAGKTCAERLATAAERRVGKLTEAHDALKTSLSAAEADRNSLDSELHACRDALAAAQADAQRASHQLSSAQRSSSHHNHQYSQLARELEEANSRAAAATAAADSARKQQTATELQARGEATAARERLASAEAVRVAVEAARAAAESAAGTAKAEQAALAAQVASVRTDLQQANEQVANLAQRYKAAMQRVCEEGGGREALVAEVGNLQAELAAANVQVASLRSEVASAVRAAAEANDAAEVLRAQLRRGDQLLGKQRGETAALEEHVTAGLAAMEGSLTRFEAAAAERLERAQARAEQEARAMASRAERLEADVQQLENELNTLTGRHRANTQLVAEVEAARRRVEELEEAGRSTVRTMARLERELEDAVAAATTQDAGAAEALARARTAASQAASQAEEARTAAAAAEARTFQERETTKTQMAQALQQVQDLEASTKMLETQCQQLGHERRELEKQLDATRHERLTTTSEHEQALAGLRRQLRSAEEALRAANEDAADRLRVEKDRRAAEAQLAAALRDENETLRERVEQQRTRATAINEEAAARSASLEAAVAAAADNIRRAHEVCCRVSGDIVVVDSYVDKMVAAGGYSAVDRDPPEILFNLTDSPDPGTGQVLMQAAKELRSQFAFLTEKVQAMVASAGSSRPAEKPASAVPTADLNKERELQATVTKLLHAEEALESTFSCMRCMNVFDAPVTCSPCGHVFCRGCAGEDGGECHECGGEISTLVENDLLENVCAKYEYKLGMLRNLASIVC